MFERKLVRISRYLACFNLFLKRNLNIVFIYVFCCLFIVSIYILTENTDISMYELVADPNEVAGVPAYTGLVSTIGSLLFCATVAICFFTAYLIKFIEPNRNKGYLFLKYSAGFILLLLVDDLWQIHENFYTLLFDVESATRLQKDIGEAIIFGIYGLLFLTYFIKFKKAIFKTELLTFILALIFLAISTTFDIFFSDVKGHFILEEGFKLLGIVSLSIYYINICVRKTRQIFSYFIESKTSNFSSKIKPYSR